MFFFPASANLIWKCILGYSCRQGRFKTTDTSLPFSFVHAGFVLGLCLRTYMSKFTLYYNHLVYYKQLKTLNVSHHSTA